MTQELSGRKKYGVETLSHLGKSSLGVLSSVFGTIAIFLLVARLVGVSEFGRFATGYAICSLIGIVFDFGYQQRLLKETHELVEKFGGLPARIFAYKAVLFVFLTPLGVLIYLLLGLPLILFSTIWIGVAFLSIGNLLSASVKCANMHGRDSINMLLANVFGFVVVMIFMAMGSTSILHYTLAFPVIGMSYLALTIPVWQGLFQVTEEVISPAKLLTEGRAGIAYAVDTFTQRGFNILDVAILAFFASDMSVGLYQAGQKIAQVFILFAQPFNTVFLPRLSRDASHDPCWRNTARNSLISMVVVGLIAGVLLIFIGPILVGMLFGDEFAPVTNFIWVFGILIVLRYSASALAIIITSLGQQKARTAVNLVSLFLFVVYAPVFSSMYGHYGMVWALVAAATIICAGFLIVLMRKPKG